jgi:signal transduction histidine kinase
MLIPNIVIACCVAVTLALSCLAADEPAQSNVTAVLIDKVAVAGRVQILGAPEPGGGNLSLKVGAGVHRFDFAFGPAAGSRATSGRLRYKFDGLDSKWHESGGLMRLTARFHNAVGDVVGFQDFEARGNSVGWKGRMADSSFRQRNEPVTVPDGAVELRLTLVSGGAAYTVGVMAVDDLKITPVGRNEPLFADDFEQGERLDDADGTPRGWQRGGLRRDVVQVAVFDKPRTNHALAVLDANVQGWGEWGMRVSLRDRVRAGEVLKFQWREMYGVGAGGPQVAGYERVPSGRYVFRVRAENPLDATVLGETTLAVEVASPLWQSVWFLLACIVAVSGVVAWSVRLFTRRRWQRRVERLEWQQDLERERTRIARDIHDDLGTNLTRMGLLGEVIEREVPPGSPAALAAEDVGKTARVMIQRMSEIVWAVNPHYDTVEGLAGYVGRYAQGFLEMAGIRCRLDLPVDLSGIAMSAEVRHNLFLAFKESLHNVAKHAGASEVEVTLSMDNLRLILAVKDDGHGFDVALRPRGNGLNNMTARMAALGGTCEIVSQSGGGTTVRLILPVGQLLVSKKTGNHHGTKT